MLSQHEGEGGLQAGGLAGSGSQGAEAVSPSCDMDLVLPSIGSQLCSHLKTAGLWGLAGLDSCREAISAVTWMPVRAGCRGCPLKSSPVPGSCRQLLPCQARLAARFSQDQLLTSSVATAAAVQ